MGTRIKKLKKIRIHREGTSELIYSAIAILVVLSAISTVTQKNWLLRLPMVRL